VICPSPIVPLCFYYLSFIDVVKSSGNVRVWESGGSKIVVGGFCYDLKLKELSDKTTLVLSNTRELDKVPSTE